MIEAETAVSATEPTRDALANPVRGYFLATRPAFFSVSLAGCLVGLAIAFRDGVAVNPWSALLTVVFALLAHAGINVLNDYYDALNGTDDLNVDRVFPFTGGSRFIQNGVLSRRQTAVYGFVLLAVVAVAGVGLVFWSGPGLLLIGIAGLAVGWGYSAPPLKWNSRGWGELSVAAGFLLIVVGTDYVQRHGFSWHPVLGGLSYALLVTNILYINQFPDLKADAAAGKRHWVVRLGARRAVWLYGLIVGTAGLWLVAMVAAGVLPPPALGACLSCVPSARAFRRLRRGYDRPRTLAPAIQSTIGAALLHGALLAAGIVLGKVI